MLNFSASCWYVLQKQQKRVSFPSLLEIRNFIYLEDTGICCQSGVRSHSTSFLLAAWKHPQGFWYLVQFKSCLKQAHCTNLAQLYEKTLRKILHCRLLFLRIDALIGSFQTLWTFGVPWDAMLLAMRRNSSTLRFHCCPLSLNCKHYCADCLRYHAAYLFFIFLYFQPSWCICLALLIRLFSVLAHSLHVSELSKAKQI